ncbi:type II toxin-antitoxin system RelE/ParE family toxin [Dokdonella sp.]|uniref:type II toxin-antitoxin system RelE/ParE family toxin n=1 Tax=Dokdonella sp. TaxID=2291710 RepID=UPI001B25C2A8|nr:type II toxin-antitoxin system RelE/ParE family toxin [Dokdonella sp.]MBO9663424.1 type II toxin-antitoxin system RelE/ParE family toxin [Dokdonella sp.]
MSGTSRQAIEGPHDRTERVHRWTAVLATVLLHTLLVLLVTQPPTPMTMSAPQGSPGGSRMDVTLLDEAHPSPPHDPALTVRQPVPVQRPKAPRAIQRPPSMPVMQGAVPMPPEAADTSTAPPTPAPAPPEPRRDTAEVGFPMRTRPSDADQANAALAAKLGSSRRQSDNNERPVGPNVGVDGFEVYYDLADETRLRAWRDQGMTELFLPMPGTRRLMVCPLEVALRRGSGACRMVEMDSPELKTIGDAREVIRIQRVYQRGSVVWSGPGPYR